MAQGRYDRKVQQLGVDVQGRLSRLKKNELLHSRANGIVLLRKARDAVMSRRLEMERVNRFQNNKNGGSYHFSVMVSTALIWAQIVFCEGM